LRIANISLDRQTSFCSIKTSICKERAAGYFDKLKLFLLLLSSLIALAYLSKAIVGDYLLEKNGVCISTVLLTKAVSVTGSKATLYINSNCTAAPMKKIH